MGLLQAEDLSHHVVGGGVQQDPAGGQTHHHVAAHRRQADGNGVRTWRGGDTQDKKETLLRRSFLGLEPRQTSR